MEFLELKMEHEGKMFGGSVGQMPGGLLIQLQGDGVLPINEFAKLHDTAS